MIRVLHSVSNMDRGGIETMLMNYYRHIDRTQVQFDFLIHKPHVGVFEKEIRQLGGRIFITPGLNPLRYPQYMHYMQQLLQEHPEIGILHAHNESLTLYALHAAKRAGLPIRIVHAHNTGILPDWKWPLKRLCKPFLSAEATELWACGNAAGRYYFGKKQWNSRGKILHNATHVDTFRFSEADRQRMRNQYGWQDKTVIGHVGRFDAQKNHARLLEIFACYAQQNEQAVLVLVGEGTLAAEMRQKAKHLGLENRIFFVGMQENVSPWYQAMDVFLMPSRFEGLPVVGIEAQAAGLPCLFSTAVPEEARLSAHAAAFSLAEKNEVWARGISRLVTNLADRKAGAEIVRNAGYDIVQEARRLQETYLQLSREGQKGAKV